MPKIKIKVDRSLIQDNLPTPPTNHHYRVERFSPLVWRVWLVNENHFNFRDDDSPVETIWGFVKSTGDVIRPTNKDKISRTKVCHITDVPSGLKYSTIIPQGPKCLHHLK